MPTTEVWINDSTGTLIFFFGTILGLIFIIRFAKNKSKIILFFGLTCFFVGCIYFIFFFRLISYIFGIPIEILLTKAGPFDSYVYVSLATYAWIGIGVTTATYLGTELLIPKKYRLIFHIPAWVLLITWELLIFLGPESFLEILTDSDIVGDTSFIIPSPAFFIMMFYALFLAGFLALGFLIRAIRIGGILEEKFVILSIGLFLIILELVFEGIKDVGLSISFIIVLRILMVVGLLMLRYGLATSRKKKKGLKLPTEVAKLAYHVVGESEGLDDQFWDLYIEQSKKLIEDYKEGKKKNP